MRLSIAGIFARCPACDGNDFAPALKATSETRNVFTCVGCRSQAHYRDLMVQIGEEAVRRARVAREATQGA